ncbi:putative nucleotidyltransferase [Kordia sp. SMS9]|uniref:nucleotidyltransferase family protein n=1 Tax=Kordia sp. SMS9 TaxID=2282170 RepID=UPI000E0CF184|nr:nucleotidyltransferase family protein [Kordia sp. SMS9]AXG70715.1 putative nucleotidyltransferase [Kordia sp. SMS9]
MEGIIKFKQQYLENSFPAFFEEFKQKEKAYQRAFIAHLKTINLDLFFYQALKKHQFLNDLDSELIQPLKQEFLLETGRDEFYKKQFFTFVDTSHFPILLLKGWQLRELIGANLYKRSCDVDILVLENDFKEAISVLEKEFNFFQKPQYIAYGQQCMLNENSMCVDLHKKLIAFKAFDTIFNLSAVELFKESEEVTHQNVQYYTFNIEMEFVHLCIHFLLHHEGYGFLLVYELKSFLERHLLTMRTDKLLAIAKKHHCVEIVIYTLLIVEKLCVFDQKLKDWIQTFVTTHDVNSAVTDSFHKEFHKENFYQNIGISNEVLKELLLNDYSDKITFVKAQISFKTYCFFRSLGKTLKIV